MFSRRKPQIRNPNIETITNDQNANDRNTIKTVGGGCRKQGPMRDDRTYLKDKVRVQGKARDGEKAEHTR